MAVGERSAGSSVRAGLPASDDAGRDENPAERIDRNLAELMEELRVAVIGVQVLFGFLLALPFTVKFADLDRGQRALYVIDLLLAALATALLIAPVAHHRLVFRQHAKQRLLFRSNAIAIAGLVTIAIAVTGSVLLVATVVCPLVLAIPLSVATALVFAGLWLVLPRVGLRRDDY